MNTYPASFGFPVETLADLTAVPTDLKITDTDPGADNTARASFAVPAVLAFADRVGGDDEVESQLTDLLADIMHLCDAAGIDYHAANGRAETIYYLPELRGAP